MITCNFIGGLGNNLFQLANLYSIHKTHNIPYFILNRAERGNIHIYGQSTDLEINDLLDNNFIYGNDSSKYKILEYYHHDIDPKNNITYKPVLISDNICYNGYFQSEKYFLNFDIKSEFVLKSKTINQIEDDYKHLFNKPTIALHYRLAGDRVLESMQFFHKNVSIDFYLKSIDIICKKNYSDFNILLFSDNIEKAVQILGDIPVIPINNENNNIKDFILMSLCDYNIIGNSTFSWWSAYLNKNNKLTIAPKSEWFGEGYSHFILDDLFPESWIKI